VSLRTAAAFVGGGAATYRAEAAAKTEREPGDPDSSATGRKSPQSWDVRASGLLYAWINKKPSRQSRIRTIVSASRFSRCTHGCRRKSAMLNEMRDLFNRQTARSRCQTQT